MTAGRGTALNPGKRFRTVAVWLAAFFSPTAYCLLLVLAAKFQVQALPGILVVTLFLLMPVVGLLVCGHMVWTSNKTASRRVGWGLLTLVAMLLQLGVLFVIIVAAISAAIGYAGSA
jgi:hypothetical protein